MKNICLALLALLTTALFGPLHLFAQEPPDSDKPAYDKGVIPVSSPQGATAFHTPHAKTYAVVVGISNYQDDGIPDLKYADRDAEAFANFLRSPAGGGLDGDHLKVLLNAQATVAQFAKQLDWLWEVAGEHDLVLIYFSGHGDIERKSITQPGYLLCWDAPARVYMAGGALNVRDLNDVVSTLSLQNKAKVVLVTDACRAGKLSGSDSGGPQATAANLARQYAGEIKILSCQPDEYSMEGEQWGGGRGAFSYHLLDGLYGLADANSDHQVNLREIGRYLEDHVSEEVAPSRQNPMTIGNPTEKLTEVLPEMVAQLKAGKRSQLQLFTATESRGIEEEVLAAADSSIVELFAVFQKAIENKQFLEPVGACADYYYEKLSKEPQLERLHSSMRRNYAASLQDEAQQVINSFLKTDMREITRTRTKKIQKYRLYPAMLDRAAQLLGPHHYFYPALMSRKNLFEGFQAFLEAGSTNNDQTVDSILGYYRKSLHWQPDNPLTFHLISRVHSRFMADLDSTEFYIRQATEFAPGWIFPMGEFAFDLMTRFHQHERAVRWLDKAYALDSTSAYLMNQYGILSTQSRLFLEADSLFKKALSFDSTNIWYWNNYALNCELMGKFRECEDAYLKTIQLDSTTVSPYSNLGNLFIKMGEYEKAEKWYRKSIEVDSLCSLCFSGLGILYANMNRLAEGETMLFKATEIDPMNYWAWNRLGNLYLETKDYPAALSAYEGVLRVDSTMPFATFAYSGTGTALERTGKLNEAIGAFRSALKLDSTNIWAMCGWARTSLKKGMPEDAEALLNQAKSIQPMEWVDYHFALLHAQTGQHDLAFEKLDHVLKAISELDYHELNSEILLEPLRSLPEWKLLMKKYFPEQYEE